MILDHPVCDRETGHCPKRVEEREEGRREEGRREEGKESGRGRRRGIRGRRKGEGEKGREECYPTWFKHGGQH